MKRSRKAFTLVELVIVIAVIAVLSAILVPVFSNVIKNANVAKLKASLNSMNVMLVERANLQDGRSSYTAEEVKTILKEVGFSLNQTPDGYSVWYDKSVNNLFLVENSRAFTEAMPHRASSSSAEILASDLLSVGLAGRELIGTTLRGGELESSTGYIGVREVEALNPYNSELLYLDETNSDISAAITTMKGAVSYAESRGSTHDEVSRIITDQFDSAYQSVKAALGNNVASDYTAKAVAQFDISHTMFIGNKGIYVPGAAEGSATECVNMLVDSSVYEIKSSYAMTPSGTVTVGITIVLPARVTQISLSGLNGYGKLNVEIDASATYSRGDVDVNISVSTRKSANSIGAITYTEAQLTYGENGEIYCVYDDGNYGAITVNGAYINANTIGASTGVDFGNDAGYSVKYLIPQFSIRADKANATINNFGDIRKVVARTYKNGDLTRYDVLAIIAEDGILKGYRYSNAGYLTNVNAIAADSYDATLAYGMNAAEAQAAFANGSPTVTIKLPAGTSGLANMQGLTAKVIYHRTAVVYEQKLTQLGSPYYAKSGVYVVGADGEFVSEVATALKEYTAEASFDGQDSVSLTLSRDEFSGIAGLPNNTYCSYGVELVRVEIWQDGRQILARYYQQPQS